MEETYVRLLCPECRKQWETRPTSLPDPSMPFDCPGCRANRRLSEFARTEHDLRAMKGF